jgi:2-methylcitrate dehydratase PrpD
MTPKTMTAAELVVAGGHWAGPNNWQEGTTSAEDVREALRTAELVAEGESAPPEHAFWNDFRFADGSVARHYFSFQSERWELR